MAYLGVSYRLTYVGKNFRSGLTDCIAMVTKPNGVVVGPFPLVEMLGIGFSGFYTHDFYTHPFVDPEGEYLVSFFSPSENNRDAKQFTLDIRPPGIRHGQHIVLFKEAVDLTVEIEMEECDG